MGNSKGYWLFSNEGNNLSIHEGYYYSEFYSDLERLLRILIDNKMLYPKYVILEQEENIDIGSNSIEETISKIKKLGDIGYLSLSGDTIIKTKSGEEKYFGVFSIEMMMFERKKFIINTDSDIWLPMRFNENKFEYVWNMEIYELNHIRIEQVLNEIENKFGWSNNDSCRGRENFDLGFMTIGYKMFLDPEVIIREYDKSPNEQFNLNNYLVEIRDAEKLVK